MKIEVESEALDTLKAMAQRLQDERDEWKKLACRARDFIDELPNYPYGADICDAIDAKCTAEPKVME